jgi:glycosyltransferase involved in cell wall biosynthesis
MICSVTIIILTHNEVRNIAECLDSVNGCGEVVVLDSGSTDGTAELVRSRGIAVHFNPFRGFGQQRNFAIDEIPTQYDWQFHLDADERLTPQLIAELQSITVSNPSQGGYQVPSKLMFCGQWLKRSGQYPGYQVRFFHKHRLRFIDYGHGQREVTEHGLGTLTNPLLHHAFSKGLDEWFRKHVLYARREAEQAMLPDAVRASIWSRDGTTRRRALKRLVNRLPDRYFLRLLQLLVWRRGLLDGWRGITYAHMLATYEGMIDVYLRLLARGVAPDQL